MTSWPFRLILLASIWGLSFLFIKIADQTLAPVQVVFSRVGLGALVIVGFSLIKGQKLPRSKLTWLHLSVVALLFNTIPFTLFAYGELQVSAIMAGLLNAVTPLVTLPLALWLLKAEKLTKLKAFGLGIGFLGVIVVLGIWQIPNLNSLSGDLECLGAATSYGAGFIYIRRYLTHRSEGPIAFTAGQLICATFETAIFLPLTKAPTSFPLSVIISIILLGAFGTGVAYILNYAIVSEAGAVAASTVTYIMPIFSTLAAIVILNEPLRWYEPVGAIIILSGAGISQGLINPKFFTRTPTEIEI